MSDFIRNKELPYLLAQHEKERIRIFPITIKPCLWKRISWLTQTEVRLKNGELLSKYDRNQIDYHLVSIIDEIMEISVHRFEDNHAELVNSFSNTEFASNLITFEKQRVNDARDEDMVKLPPPPETILFP